MSDIDWTAVQNFFENVLTLQGEWNDFPSSMELKVIVRSPVYGKEMEVSIPDFKVRSFMKNLPTYKAVVRDLPKQSHMD